MKCDCETCTLRRENGWLRHRVTLLEGMLTAVGATSLPPRAVGDRVSLIEIRREAAREYRVPLNDLTSTRRTRPVVTARHVAMYLARKLTESSYTDIGRSFDKDHASVINAYEKIESQLAVDPTLRVEVLRIAAALGVSLELPAMEET